MNHMLPVEMLYMQVLIMKQYLREAENDLRDVMLFFGMVEIMIFHFINLI